MKLMPLDAAYHGDHFNIFFVCSLKLADKDLKISKNWKEDKS